MSPQIIVSCIVDVLIMLIVLWFEKELKIWNWLFFVACFIIQTNFDITIFQIWWNHKFMNNLSTFEMDLWDGHRSRSTWQMSGSILIFSSLAQAYHEFHESCHSFTFIVLVNSHQRWKQTRNRVCFHHWCELTLAL